MAQGFQSSADLELSAETFNEFLNTHSEVLLERIATIWNFVFEYQNDSYEKVTVDWLSENVPVRALRVVAKEVLVQNQLGGTLPFLENMGRQFKATMEQALLGTD